MPKAAPTTKKSQGRTFLRGGCGFLGRFGDITRQRNEDKKQAYSAKRRTPGLVNFVGAVAYHFCLALPEAFKQPRDHLSAEPCRKGGRGGGPDIPRVVLRLRPRRPSSTPSGTTTSGCCVFPPFHVRREVCFARSSLLRPLCRFFPCSHGRHAKFAVERTQIGVTDATDCGSKWRCRQRRARACPLNSPSVA